MTEIVGLLPLLNLLLLPALGALWKLSTQLATLTAVQAEHGRRLDQHDTQHQRQARAA